MEQETGATQDYYILFRESNVPASAPEFVWCYAGKLTHKQAVKAQTKLDHKLLERFKHKKNLATAVSLDIPNEISVTPHSADALSFLVRKFPKMYFLDNVPPHRTIRILPKYESLKQKILAELSLHSAQGVADFSFGCNPDKPAFSKATRSFMQLLPLSRLVDIWQRVGYPPYTKDILRCTAVIWFRQTRYNDTFYLSGRANIPKKTERIFNSSIDDQKLTDRQRQELRRGVYGVNDIRKADGCITALAGKISGFSLQSVFSCVVML